MHSVLRWSYVLVHTDSLGADNAAVSPVIGVVLMVGITVILATVIGTFVLNLGNDLDRNVQAGVNVKGDAANNEISVTFTSQRDAEYLIVNIGANGSWSSGGDAVLSQVGNSVTYPTSGSLTDGDYQVLVTAYRKDQSTVVLDKEVSI